MTSPQPEAPTFRDATLYDVPQLALLDLICFPDHAFPSETIQRFIELGQPCVVVEGTASEGVVAFQLSNAAVAARDCYSTQLCCARLRGFLDRITPRIDSGRA